jgi:thioredoxin-related protein
MENRQTHFFSREIKIAFSFLIIVLLTAVSAFNGIAQETQSAYSIEAGKISWESVMEDAQKKDKLIMVSIIAEWCYWCRAMEETTLKDERIVSKLNKHFVHLSLNADQEAGQVFSAKHRVVSYPTLLFFGKKGEFLDKKTGYIRDIEEFESFLIKLTEKEFEDYPSFEFDPHNLQPGFPQFYLTHFFGSDAEKIDFTDDAVAYLSSLDHEQFLDEIPWSVIYVMGITFGPAGQHFLDNYEKYKKAFGHEEAYSHLQQLFKDRVSFYASTRNEEAMLKWINTLPDYDKRADEDILLRYKIAYYMEAGDYPGVIRQMELHLKNSSSPNLNSINSICMSIHDLTADREILSSAADLMGKVVAKDNHYYHLDSYAALLYRSGQMEKGKKMALQAIKRGKELDIDVSDTEILIEIYEQD